MISFLDATLKVRQEQKWQGQLRGYSIIQTREDCNLS